MPRTRQAIATRVVAAIAIVCLVVGVGTSFRHVVTDRTVALILAIAAIGGGAAAHFVPKQALRAAVEELQQQLHRIVRSLRASDG